MNKLVQIMIWSLVVALVATGIGIHYIGRAQVSIENDGIVIDGERIDVDFDGNFIEDLSVLGDVIITEIDEAMNWKRYEDLQSIEGIELVDINTVSGKVNIEYGDVSQIQVIANIGSTVQDEKKRPQMRTEVKNGTYRVWIDYPRVVSFFNHSSVELSVLLPKEYEQQLDASTTSGEIRVGYDVAKVVKYLSTVSGDVFIAQGVGNFMEISTTSGDVNANKVTADKIVINTISGDVKLSNINSSIWFDSVSGSFVGDNITMDQRNDFQTISGDVVIDVTSIDNLDIRSSSLSGKTTVHTSSTTKEVSDDKMMLKFGDGSIKVEFSSTSGDLTIK